MPGVLSKMSLQVLLSIAGLVAVLALIFPRPAKKPKDDKKFYSKPPAFIAPGYLLNQIGRFFEDFLGIRLIKPNTE